MIYSLDDVQFDPVDSNPAMEAYYCDQLAIAMACDESDGEIGGEAQIGRKP